MSTVLPPDIVRISLPTPFIVGPVNAFLIKREPLTLVDTGPGTEECYAALVAGLAAYGITLGDIEAVLVTHGHIDHIGLLSRIVEESAADTYAHESVAAHAMEYHEGERESREFLLQIFQQFGVSDEVLELTSKTRDAFKTLGNPAHIQHAVKDGEQVLGYDVYHVPGHSSSDTIFVEASRRLAFTGDHVLKGVNPTPLIRRDRQTGERVKSMLEYELSLNRTAALGLEILYPGHGAAIAEPDEVLYRIMQRHHNRTERVLALVSERAVTPYDVSKLLFPGLAPEHTYLALSTAIGHLDILDGLGVLNVEVRDGVHYYSAK